MVLFAKRTQFVSVLTDACLLSRDVADALGLDAAYRNEPVKIVYPHEAVDEAIGELDASKVLKRQRLNSQL